MSRDHTQEALDEYYSTGIDPTGGEIGPDSKLETGEEYESLDDAVEAWCRRMDAAIDARTADVEAYERAQHRAKATKATPRHSSFTPTPNPKPNKQDNKIVIFFFAVIIGFFAIAGISGIVRKHNEKVQAEHAARDREWAEYQRELQLQKEVEAARNAHIKTPEEIEAEKQATREEVQRLLNSGQGLYGQGVTPNTSSAKPAKVQSNLPKRGTPYGDGYWAGYEEGYDDADGYNSYGYKYDESTAKYSGRALSEYIRGYRKGYRDGWEEGQEDLEDRFNMGDEEIDEGDW